MISEAPLSLDSPHTLPHHPFRRCTRSLKTTEGRGSNHARVFEHWFKMHDDGVSSLNKKCFSLLWFGESWYRYSFRFESSRSETGNVDSHFTYLAYYIENQLAAGRWLVNKNMAKPFQDHERALFYEMGIRYGWGELLVYRGEQSDSLVFLLISYLHIGHMLKGKLIYVRL